MIEIKLNSEYKTIIDAEDFLKIKDLTWYMNRSPHKRKYARSFLQMVGAKHKTVYLHRYILNISDPKIKVIHLNGDTLDNRKSNLRVITRGISRRNYEHSKL